MDECYPHPQSLHESKPFDTRQFEKCANCWNPPNCGRSEQAIFRSSRIANANNKGPIGLVLVLMVLSLLGVTSEIDAGSPDAAKDTVTFTNGDVLTGNILRTTSQTVVFSNDSVGTLNLKWSDLRKVTFSHPMKVTTRGAPEVRLFDGGIVTVVRTGARLDLDVTPSAGATAANLQDVQSITGGPTKCASGIREACPGWQLDSVKVDLSYLGATQTDQTYGGSLVTKGNWNPEDQGWPHQRTLLDLQASYDDKRKGDKPGDANITQEYDGRLQHLLFITSDAFYASTVADLYHNNSLGLYLEQSYGGGFGRIWQGWEFDADLRLIGEHFYGPNPSASLIGSQLSERRSFLLNWIKPGTTFVELGKYTPVFNMSSAWQLYGRGDLNVPITKKLQVTFSVSDNYVENAPAPYRKNYLKTMAGLEFDPNPKH